MSCSTPGPSVQCQSTQAPSTEGPQELIGSSRVVEHRHVDIPCRMDREGCHNPQQSPQLSNPQTPCSPVPVSTFTFCVLPRATATYFSTCLMLSLASGSP